jgi:hypothetical protein
MESENDQGGGTIFYIPEIYNRKSGELVDGVYVMA